MRHKGQSQRTPGGTGSTIERGNTINKIKQSDHLKMQYQITISTRILIWVSLSIFSAEFRDPQTETGRFRTETIRFDYF